MVEYQVESGQDISISDFILSLIESQSMRHMWNSVPPWRLLGIISQRHYRDLNSIDFVISLLISMNMILPHIM